MNQDLPPEKLAAIAWNPQEDASVISIIRQPDGNYRGFANRNGQLIQVRAGDPQTVLTMLITHA
jgi:hypothetical protein